MKLTFAALKPPEVPTWTVPSNAPPMLPHEYSARYVEYLTLYEQYNFQVRLAAERQGKLAYTPAVAGTTRPSVISRCVIMKQDHKAFLAKDKMVQRLPGNYLDFVPKSQHDLYEIHEESLSGSPLPKLSFAAPPVAKVPTDAEKQQKAERAKGRRRRARARKSLAKRQAKLATVVADVKIAKSELAFTVVTRKKKRASAKKTAARAAPGPNEVSSDVASKDATPRKPNRKERRYAIYGPPKGSPSQG
jgi:hypothetical protein